MTTDRPFGLDRRGFPERGRGIEKGMNTEPPKVHRVERVDDIPVLLATLNS